MKKTKESLSNPAFENSEQAQSDLDRQSVLDFFKRKVDEKVKTAQQRAAAQEQEIFELVNGKRTSIHDEKEKQRKILSSIPQNHEPKFCQFFQALGELMNWTEDEKKRYHKPKVAPNTINEVIYDRFPRTVVAHIHSKNPYVKWCTREFKNYLFLAEDGILLLEKFIDDAVVVLQESTSLYDFRIKHASKFGSGFQPVLFEDYFRSV